MSSIRDDLAGAPLGAATAYPDAYDAALLFPVLRAQQREEIGLTDNLPFTGDDFWTAFELTWLDIHGKPQVAIATFIVPGTSPAIVESKSVKLYLGAFAQTRFDDAAEVAATIERDLSHATAAPVQIELTAPGKYRSERAAELDGESLDDLPVLVDGFIVTVAALAAVRLNPSCHQWLIFAHRSAERGHALVLEELSASPILDLGLRLGEASGAAVALPVLRLACALHNGMATFAEAAVSGKAE